MARDNLLALVVPSFNMEASRIAYEQAKDFEPVFAALGVHPHHASSFNAEAAEFLAKNAEHKKVVAIGEIGLDYFRNLSPVNSQRHAMLKQMEIAKKFNLPVIFHVRNAFDDFFKLIEENSYLLTKGVVHCFPGGAREAEKALELGLMISFTGNITYKKSEPIAEAAKIIPLNRIMVETDCPYLAPGAERGKTCYPRYVVEVARKLAEIKGISFEEVAKATTENALNFFSKMRGQV